MSQQDHAAYLAPGRFVDSDHPSIRAFAHKTVGGETDARAKALKLYYAVRDDILYDPYRLEMTPEGFKASTCLERGYGFCVTKAAVLGAAARAVGVPARVGYADVLNHLATERLRKLMQTDLFVYHGYTELLLDGRWVKATPAFNLKLCEKFRVLPLDFDGKTDSVFHPFDADGRKHMEYVRDRGVFADVPFEDIDAEFRRLYFRMYDFDRKGGGAKGDFAAEAEAEAKSKAAPSQK
jgi:transglutaminase-like putative cysteine protease